MFWWESRVMVGENRTIASWHATVADLGIEFGGGGEFPFGREFEGG